MKKITKLKITITAELENIIGEAPDPRHNRIETSCSFPVDWSTTGAALTRTEAIGCLGEDLLKIIEVEVKK